MVEISKETLTRLRIAEMRLHRLEAGGVDNWEGYGYSLNPDGELSYEDMVEQIKKET